MVRDTIAAIATARGRAGIGVVRVSGDAVPAVARLVLGDLPAARHAALRTFRDGSGEPIDRGIALYFPAPGSYTGEHVLELQAHGGAAVLDALLEAVVAAGARPARPGEFTERAFLEGRLDLVQAEAVADLIDAGSRRAARAARATLSGVFSRQVRRIAASLLEQRVRLEADLDFSEEDLEPARDDAVAQRLAALARLVEQTLEEADRGVRLNDRLRAVLVGAPNVGKSSILNRLAGDERAIVTALPGTTRDVLREELTLGPLQIELVDTAGLRDSDDVIERAGIARTHREIEGADLLLVVLDDGGQGGEPDLPPGLDADAPRLLVRNKVDLSGARAGDAADGVRVSARTGAGFPELVNALLARADVLSGEGRFTARRRHVAALRRARDALAAAAALHEAGRGSELVAEELRLAHEAVGEITGTVRSDDLLGAIFATFCIGK